MSISSKKNKIESDNPTSNRSSPLKILVVDDDFISRKLVLHMIDKMGIHVDSADGGQPAKDYLNKTKYDVLITDLKMPDIDGYTLSCWLKRRAPDIKVVIMTGCRSSEIDNYRKTEVVDDWISKPISVNELLSILKKLIPTKIQKMPAEI